MGIEIDSTSFSKEDFRAFAARLKEETELFKTWWKQGGLAAEPPRFGFELEAWLIDQAGNPAR
ncbi:hypothetical protein [Alkalilimnicola ehrlichii]|uniref:hypothetical protein n=1 Tax=Alkalilimnicola ehrlichii TaxID=351052 RepID=UPI0021632184|nr:hypothetical protein [Alkalilimnicola ehrlichii]